MIELDAKRRARMEKIDRLSPALRRVVHAYGWHVVDNFMRCGVTRPGRIRHLVELVLDEFSPTRGSFSKQGIGKGALHPVSSDAEARHHVEGEHP